MKIKLIKLSFFMTLIISAIGLGSCQKENEFKKATLTISEKEWTPTMEAGSLELTLETNRDWSVEKLGENDLTWIAITPEAGKAGSHPITLNVLANTGDAREVVLRFDTGTTYESIKIIQAGTYSKDQAVTEFADNFSSNTTGGQEYENKNWTITSSEVGIGWRTGYFPASTPPETSLEIKAYEASSDVLTAYAKMVPFNVKGATVARLTCAVAWYYQEADATKLELVASEDYEGDMAAATWTVVNDLTLQAGTDLNKPISFDISLAEYSSKEIVHFAFRYTGKAITYRLYNVEFGKGDVPMPGEEPKTIAELRTMTDVAEKNYVVTGRVVSNNSETDGGNLHNQSIVIQDSKSINSAIVIRTKAKHSFKLGEEIKVSTFKGQLSKYNGTMQLAVGSDDMITKTDKVDLPAVEALLQTITVSQLKTDNYQSMYVAIDQTQIEAAEFGKMFNDGAEETTGNIKASSNAKEFNIYTTKYATFAKNVVPEGKGILKGIVAIYERDGTTNFQMQAQRPSDFAGLGGSDPAPDPSTALFHETFGVVAKTTPFATAMAGFSKTNQPNAEYSISYTKIDIRSSNSSADTYVGSTGEGNVWFGGLDGTNPNVLTMDKLTIAEASVLSFGLNINSGQHVATELIISYRVGDVAWTDLSYTIAEKVGKWALATCTEMPTGVTAIKITSSAGSKYRLDDIKISKVSK